jgi:hypothetical protein
LGGLWFEVSLGNPSRDPVSKITRAKWTGSMAQVLEYLVCKVQSTEFKPQSHQKKKKKTRKIIVFSIVK